MGLADGTAWEKEHPVAASPVIAPFDTADADEATELVDELVSTTTLYETFGRFIAHVQYNFSALKAISEESNPVRTHLSIVSVEEELLQAAHNLRDELIEKLAERGEKITEKGGTLRTQVLNDEAEED
jgi:hypothetical protein